VGIYVCIYICRQLFPRRRGRGRAEGKLPPEPREGEWWAGLRPLKNHFESHLTVVCLDNSRYSYIYVAHEPSREKHCTLAPLAIYAVTHPRARHPSAVSTDAKHVGYVGSLFALIGL